MWANMTPLFSKFPRLPLNGTSNGTHTDDWSACLADLERYRAYSDDWDGQGAKGIPGNLIDSAVALAGLLRSQAVTPPTCVLPGFDGTVGFEWDTAGGGSIKLEITGSEVADFERYTPTEPLEVIKLAEPVNAEDLTWALINTPEFVFND
jgi:hypothetical protein